MAIFLDTGNVQEVEKYMKMGVIRGVTTNPTILLKDGVKGGKVHALESMLYRCYYIFCGSTMSYIPI